MPPGASSADLCSQKHLLAGTEPVLYLEGAMGLAKQGAETVEGAGVSMMTPKPGRTAMPCLCFTPL